MRRMCFLIALAMLLWGGSLSATAKVYTTYEFPHMVWKDAEKQGFAISDRGLEVGEAELWIKEIEYFDQTAYMVEYREQDWDPKDNSIITYKEDTVTKISGIGLKPLAVTKRIEIGEEIWYYEGNFTGDQLVVSYTTPQNPFKDKMSMSAGVDFYSAEVLPYMLRNLDFAAGDLYTFTLLGVEDLHLQSAIVEVKGEEIVEVPSGVYDCWKVDIRMGGMTYEAWYSKKQPQFLIKYYFGKEMGMKNHT